MKRPRSCRTLRKVAAAATAEVAVGTEEVAAATAVVAVGTAGVAAAVTAEAGAAAEGEAAEAAEAAGRGRRQGFSSGSIGTLAGGWELFPPPWWISSKLRERAFPS